MVLPKIRILQNFSWIVSISQVSSFFEWFYASWSLEFSAKQSRPSHLGISIFRCQTAYSVTVLESYKMNLEVLMCLGTSSRLKLI